MNSSGKTVDYAGSRALVLGAGGFIGRWVSRALADRGAAVVQVVRDRRAFEPVYRDWRLAGEVIEADLAGPGRIAGVVEAVRPDITFNLIGYGVDPRERDETVSHRINAGLPAELASAVAAVRNPEWRGLDLVHTGSALEYGTATGSISEDTVPQPATLYGRTKLEGTRAVTAAAGRGLKAVTARLFTVYGPGEHRGRLLPSLIEAAQTKAAIELTSGLQKRDFTYVEEIAEGLCRIGLSRARPGEVIHLAAGSLITVRDFVKIAGAVLQIPAERLQFGKIPTRTEEMEHSEVHTGRLRVLTRWSPSVDVGEGVRRTLGFLEGLRRGWTRWDAGAPPSTGCKSQSTVCT